MRQTSQRTPPPKKRSSKKANREAEIIQAAIEVFWQKGYRAASIQDVAEKVGVLKGSLYYYIETKEDLIWRIIEDVHREWSEILDKAEASSGGPLEKIRVLIELHVEWYLKNKKEVGVFFREWQHLSGERLQTVRTRRRHYEQVVQDLITEGQQAGAVSAEIDPHYAALYVLAAVNAVPDWYRPPSGGPAAHVAEAFADMTVGLLVGTGRSDGRPA
jgi:AcrR family transcriptional regulator